MWGILVSLFLKLFDFFPILANRTTVRITVKYLKYQLRQSDSGIISPYSPSHYFAKLAFSHSGKPTTIIRLTLFIDKTQLPSEHFKPLKLEQGYREISAVFPIEESQAVTEGNFKIQAEATFGKPYKCTGYFPIDQ